MKIIVFLGNPGRQYLRTRHNTGFIIGEYFCDRNGIVPSQKKFKAFAGTGTVEGKDVCVLFPQTFMNLSGESAVQAVKFFRADPADVIAVHDEIELPFGKTGVKIGGGHKGHNGIRSLIQLLGTPDFVRVRFGVGRPDNPNVPVADYLLSSFLPEEMDGLMKLLPETERIIKEQIRA